MGALNPDPLAHLPAYPRRPRPASALVPSMSGLTRHILVSGQTSALCVAVPCSSRSSWPIFDSQFRQPKDPGESNGQRLTSNVSLPPRLGGELATLSPSHPTPTASGVFSQPPESLFNDPHETHDHEPTSYPKQRQQHSTLLPTQQTLHHQDPDPVSRLSTPASSVQRSLRRTPRFESAPSPSPASTEPRQVHIAAASIGFSPSPVPFARTRPDSSVTGLSSSLFEDRARLHRNNSQDLEESLEKDISSDRPHSQHQSGPHSPPRRDRREPHPVVRVSRNTHSAILFALEEALRHPNPFTPDVVEESADMADLMAATSGLPATSDGNGAASTRRPSAGPAPTSSPSGIRGPRMIMQERAAREARQRAEAEQLALERSRAEQEARLLDETRRRNAERRSAGVAAGQPSGTEPQQLQQQHQSPPLGHGQAVQEATHGPRAPAAVPTAKTSAEQRIPAQFAPNATQQPTRSPTYVTSSGRPRAQQQASAAAEPTTQPTEPAKPRNSFPHAFERWETLSAHWEGLTSYWIRKLEQNKDDINRDPLSQQLARQVTDLSAAGANLFHAVVELQRLRASSERKFQRWFFETRAELERAQEVNGMLEKALERERRDRADAIRDAIDHERGTSKAQKQLTEMRKELRISKEEARRAWEELGRREQEERDRTLSLQSGHPTIVGGVQVVPMTHGGVSRQGTTTRETEAYQAEYPQSYGPEHSQAPPSATSPTTAGPSGTYYRPHEQGQSHARGRSGGSEGAFSEGEYIIDAAGNFVLDSRGQKIPFVAAPPSGASVSDPEADDYDTPATTNPPSGAHEPASTSEGEGRWTGAYSDPQDYSGQGYGAPGWETVPRHHHPTRLSDVIEEEDERSRTSASQSRGH
ncbi:hypothetical protein J3458_019738 [Metarhizium acridum]|uniref:uncharacterized protein n=1 Tax=Metarhizium acridum TaxID=92637 RepID=UPI001C6CC707|nr:hypothetical protein J3458_019738 [Metarhizium acridum]